MKKHLLVLSFSLLFAGFSLTAATHIITFGGAAGLNYMPSNVGADIGDEIIFQGNFSSHPLSSVSVPVGASDFANNTGTADFSYTVTIAGIYNYQCDFHSAGGMVGSFTVADPLKINQILDPTVTVTLFPNPSSDHVNINISSQSKNTYANIYSVNGTVVKSLFLGSNNVNRVAIDDLKPGIYLVQITNNVNLNQNIRFIKQ